MLEVKRKDEALNGLREDLARYAPDVAARFGYASAEPAPDPPVEFAATEPDT